MNREQVFGLETEYSASIRRRDGSFLHTPNVEKFFFSPLRKILFSSGDEPDALLRRIALMRDYECAYWVGASAGKLYRDNDSIEYATPECVTLAGIVRAAECGDRIVWEFSRLAQKKYASRSTNKYAEMIIVKNNSDAIGGACIQDAHFSGSHESYQMQGRFTQDDLFLPALASCLVMRMLFTGGGGIVRGRNTGWQYVISPRALATSMVYHTVCVSAESRPMISYRGGSYSSLDWLDSPPGKLRLHIAVNDSTMRPDTIRFRFGFVNMLLCLLEDRRRKKILPLLRDPIQALHDFSQDTTLSVSVPLENGGMRTLPELCRDWLEIFSAFNAGNSSAFSSEEKTLLKDAKLLLSLRGSDPKQFLQNTEWGLKFFLLSAYCRKRGIDFGHKNARGFDGYYSDIGPDGLYHRWERSCAEQKSDISELFFDTKQGALLSDEGFAPRALLRKRHLEALAEAGCRTIDINWGSFELSNEGCVEISNPMRGGHPRIEKDIALLKRGLKSEI